MHVPQISESTKSLLGSRFYRGRRLVSPIQWGQHDSLYISVVTRTEILAGMRPQEETVTLELLDALNSLPVDGRIADRAGRMIYDLARRGVQLSFSDALIAGTALELKLTVVTTNAMHFEPTGAQLERWE